MITESLSEKEEGSESERLGGATLPEEAQGMQAASARQGNRLSPSSRRNTLLLSS